MPLIKTLVRGLSTQPAYTLMRGAGRFAAVRSLAAWLRGLAHAHRLRAFLAAQEAQLSRSAFADLDRERFVEDLRSQGLAFGLRLPAGDVDEILRFAQGHPCYADRREDKGFMPQQHAEAERRLGKPLLLAQYFNVAADCPAVARLVQDPMLQWIAGRYLQSIPTFVGVNLWWTFPVQPTAADRDLHAHLFHRDVDDFRFFKFFFYLTDVLPGEGAHVCVVASHRSPPALRASDRWTIRRYSDEEITRQYPAADIREICGEAGTGFAENTLCVHKGRTPESRARLLLQVQFAMFDYGFMHDRRDPAQLALIA